MGGSGSMKKNTEDLPSGRNTRLIKEVNASGTTLCIFLLIALWASSASAFETWSENSAANTGNCATCHGNFGQMMPVGPAYSSLVDGSMWSFPGEPFTPVSLMDRHSSALFPDLGLRCEACHDVFSEAPVKLNSSLNGTTCVTCHDGTDLRASHRASTKFLNMTSGLPDTTKNCADSCHTDGDGDGVTDHFDNCPTEVDQGYGVDENGCPNPPSDGDSDGVLDNDDACPAEGDQGYGVDATGCPNPPTDGDGDGVMDNDDSCPTDGDKGYGVDASGCPNPATDIDGDGVMDNDDACPNEGDQGNGIDATGCPIAASQGTIATASSGGGGGGYISPLFALFMLLYALNPLRIRRQH